VCVRERGRQRGKESIVLVCVCLCACACVLMMLMTSLTRGMDARGAGPGPPRQTSTSTTCDPNADCVGGACVCRPGYVGTGLSCTRTPDPSMHTPQWNDTDAAGGWLPMCACLCWSLACVCTLSCLPPVYLYGDPAWPSLSFSACVSSLCLCLCVSVCVWVASVLWQLCVRAQCGVPRRQQLRHVMQPGLCLERHRLPAYACAPPPHPPPCARSGP
jgi:hypothetical protein